MNFFSRQQVIIWILAGLLVITLSILGSMIYYSWSETEEIAPKQACSSTCMMMFEELALDSTQNEAIEMILTHYSDSSAILITELRQQRLILMEELQQDDPDRQKLWVLSDELGEIQTRMTMLAASQYLQIRSVCTPEQRQQLSNIYCDIFGCSRINPSNQACSDSL